LAREVESDDAFAYEGNPVAAFRLAVISGFSVLSSMGDSNSCPSVANRAVWAREILTQIEGQFKGALRRRVVGDDERRPATASNARNPYFIRLFFMSWRRLAMASEDW